MILYIQFVDENVVFQYKTIYMYDVKKKDLGSKEYINIYNLSKIYIYI